MTLCQKLIQTTSYIRGAHVRAIHVTSGSCLHHRENRLPWYHTPLWMKKIRRKERRDPSYLEPLLEWKQKKQQEKLEREMGEFKEPEPHAMHMVQLAVSLRKSFYYEKMALSKLGLSKKHEVAVVKNTPRNNEILKDMSHLLIVKPITFPHGMPEDPSDIDHTLLKSNGEFIVKKKLLGAEEIAKAEEEPNPREEWAMTRDTINEKIKGDFKNFHTHEEYNPTRYRYKHNQDGREYRYNMYGYRKKQKNDIAPVLLHQKW